MHFCIVWSVSDNWYIILHRSIKTVCTIFGAKLYKLAIEALEFIILRAMLKVFQMKLCDMNLVTYSVHYCYYPLHIFIINKYLSTVE